MYYEFINTLEDEITIASQKKNEKRLQILQTLRKRFPKLLLDLNILLIETPIIWAKTEEYLEKMSQFRMNIGDILILETIKYHKIDLIVTTDNDWERTGIPCKIINIKIGSVE